MKLFTFHCADSNFRTYVYASGYGPLKCDMPFLKGILLERQMAFWKVCPSPPGIAIDFLHNGNSPPMEFISERVVRDLEEEGIPYACYTRMPIATILSKSKKLQNHLPPVYGVLEAMPGIKLHDKASGITRDAEGKVILTEPWKAIKWKYDASTWDGRDLFGKSSIFPGPTDDLVCTQRIVNLADAKGWTNVKFRELEVV
jgi:hypothetical protein